VGLLVGGAGIGAATYAGTSSSGKTTTVVRQVYASSSPAARTSSSDLSVSEIYKRDGPGVVEITVTESASGGSSPFPFGNGGSQSQKAQGSGFVYDTNGNIVTNEHVVDGASSVKVTLADGSTYNATVVGKDPSTDLAVVHIDAPASKLHPLTLADSSTVQVGDGVVAIGSPFGLENSVTSGIVSALHRQIQAPNNYTINDALQTDAAINHGNSGGVLLDLQGRVIGVTSQIESNSGANDGVGFAVPSNTVKSVVGQLISSGNASHAYLGVQITTIPASAASQLGESAGVAVTQVRSGSPAADAGLKASTRTKTVGGETYPTGGDVITKFDGTTVTSSLQLEELVSAKKPGDKVTLTVTRNGNERTASVTLGNRPS
jgi:putative serine protease PepD